MIQGNHIQGMRCFTSQIRTIVELAVQAMSVKGHRLSDQEVPPLRVARINMSTRCPDLPQVLTLNPQSCCTHFHVLAAIWQKQDIGVCLHCIKPVILSTNPPPNPTPQKAKGLEVCKLWV